MSFGIKCNISIFTVGVKCVVFAIAELNAEDEEHKEANKYT